MKFLENVGPDQEVQPLNYIYFNGTDFTKDDVLAVVYKDVKSGQIIVQNIVKPMMEVWFVKPEYRDKVTYIHNWLPSEWLYPKKIRYRSRFHDAAKELGLNSPDDAKHSPWISEIDMDIRRYYAVQFLLEYKLPQVKKLNLGFFDIESDIVDIDHWPEPGEVPISCMTFIDGSAKSAYTFIYEPQTHAQKKDPDTGDYYDYRDQVKDLKEHLDDFQKEVHTTFDDAYPGFVYTFLFEKDEVELVRHFFQLVDASNIDFALAWNIAYDMAHLTARPMVLGADPCQVCTIPKKFKVLECSFKEDKNPLAQKRRHITQLSHPTVFLDQMVNYAGIRSAQGTIPSLKLNAIGQTVLGDTKINYDEAGNLTNLLYTNFRKYVIYNIKDVLLQWGIENKTHDMNDIYNRMTADGLLPFEIFTSTQMLTNSLTKDLVGMGYHIGINKNRLTADQYNVADYNMDEDEEEDSGEEGDTSDPYENAAVASELEANNGDIVFMPMPGVIGRKSKKGFEGAMVQNPNRMMSTGTRIAGIENSKVQAFVIDMDYSAMYPSNIMAQNLSNETLIGRVEIVDDVYDYFYLKKGKAFCDSRMVGNARIWTQSDLQEYLYNRLPKYNYDYIGDDAKTLKINISDIFLEYLMQNAITQLANQFMNLPTAEQLVEAGELKPVFVKEPTQEA